MLDDLEPVIHDAMMRILSTIYETGMVQEVRLGPIYNWFGAEPPADDAILDFAGKQWIKDYILFNKPDSEEFQMKMVDMDTGEVTHKKVTKDELAEILDNADEISEGLQGLFDDDNPEDETLEPDDLDSHRIIH